MVRRRSTKPFYIFFVYFLAVSTPPHNASWGRQQYILYVHREGTNEKCREL